MKVLFALLAVFACALLLSQWARSFSIEDARTRVRSALAFAFHVPVGFSFSGLVALGNARAPQPILVSLGNEAPLFRDSGGDLPAGVIALANEGRLAAATYSEALTAYVAGWKDPENIQATLDFIAPPVPVARRFEFKKGVNSEAFLSETDDIRAIGGEFKRVEYRGDTVNEKTHNKGLTYRLDKDEEGGAVTEEMIVGRLTSRLWRNELRRAFTALLAAATNANKTWGSSANPDEDMKVAIAAAQLDSGIFPNRAIIGLAAWNLRSTSMAAQATAGAFAGLSMNPDQVGALLGLSGGMRISKEVYQSSATVKSRALGSYFATFYAENGVGKDDPTNIKRFFTPMGTPIRVLRQDLGGKYVDISVEHYSNVVATSTVGAQKLTVS